jgi:hypothetical protein
LALASFSEEVIIMKRAILSAFVLLLATQVHAQPPGGAGGQGLPDNETILGNNDGNGDGQITREEATAAGFQLATSFDTFDTDGDGIVTVAELDGIRAGAGGGAPGARAGGPGPGARAGGPAPAPAAAEDDDEEEDEN